jgi:hypothetical protein
MVSMSSALSIRIDTNGRVKKKSNDSVAVTAAAAPAGRPPRIAAHATTNTRINARFALSMSLRNGTSTTETAIEPSPPTATPASLCPSPMRDREPDARRCPGRAASGAPPRKPRVGNPGGLLLPARGSSMHTTTTNCYPLDESSADTAASTHSRAQWFGASRGLAASTWATTRINGYIITPYVGTTALGPRNFNSTETTETVTGLTSGTT